MLRLQRHGSAQGGGKAFHSLFRKTVDQVKAHVFEFGFPCGIHRRAHLLESMDPAHSAQLSFDGGLHAQGNTVETCPAQGAQGAPISGAVGVRLQRDFSILGKDIVLLHG